MKRGILKNKEGNTFLNKKGYVVLNVISSDQINKFLSLYKQYAEDLDIKSGFHITMEHASVEVRTKTSEFLVKQFNEILKTHFQEFKLFQGSFIIKEKGFSNNEVGAHQDWSFVDESKGCKSYTMWIALSDVEKENGAIELIPESHTTLNQIRYTPNEVYEGHKNIEKLSKDSDYKTIEVKAGQAILWDHRLIHKSSPNLSKKDRISITLGVTEKNNQLMVYWQNPIDKSIMKIDVEDQFYYKNNSETLYNFFQNQKTPK